MLDLLGIKFQSLRHTFAVNRLREWYREDKDINAVIANLSVYLGHIGPEETYWYLTATPELLGEASDRFRQYAKGGDNEKAKI